jgi:hypothetical protein
LFFLLFARLANLLISTNWQSQRAWLISIQKISAMIDNHIGKAAVQNCIERIRLLRYGRLDATVL